MKELYVVTCTKTGEYTIIVPGKFIEAMAPSFVRFVPKDPFSDSYAFLTNFYVWENKYIKCLYSKSNGTKTMYVPGVIQKIGRSILLRKTENDSENFEKPPEKLEILVDESESTSFSRHDISYLFRSGFISKESYDKLLLQTILSEK